MSDAPSPFQAPHDPGLTLRVEPPRVSWKDRLKKLFAPFAAVFAVIAKFFAVIKGLLIPLLPVLKTGGTMLISIWFYAQGWGWPFAVGFVVLIFAHECGHLVVARWFGLKVGAPMFIPFMGALIALKQAPHNAWVEACVGIGGPVAGSLGAAGCLLIYQVNGDLFWRDLAFTGFFLNLFNLTPIGFLDGGRIVTALSPWLWVVGLVIMGAMAWVHPNFLLILILIMSLPRLWSLFRPKTEAQRRYFEIPPWQRWAMAAMYFGLVALLGWGMFATAR
jgi:Zn-dependent protease